MSIGAIPFGVIYGVVAIGAGADLVAALVGGIVAVAAYDLRYKLGLILAAFCGIAAGLFVSRLRQ